MNDVDLAVAAGCGSYDGYQERANRLLMARLTAERSGELYPGDEEPGCSFRLAAEAEVVAATLAFRPAQ